MTHLLQPGPSALVADVGGTTIKIAHVDAAGGVTGPTRIPTPRDGARTPERILDAIADERGGRTDAIGIAIPGIVDDDRGIGVFSENLDWRDVDFRSLAERRFGSPVAVMHDVRAAGLAELRLGAAAGLRDALILAIGTGISASVVANGRMVVAGGFAGEIGHAVVVDGGEQCVCGNRGCLEATASAAAIARRYARETGRDVPGAREVVERAGAGDAAAATVWNEALDALALGISHAAALTGPEAVVIGGGLSEAGDALFGPLRARLDDRYRLRRVPVRRATLGEDAGVIGVALRARGDA